MGVGYILGSVAMMVVFMGMSWLVMSRMHLNSYVQTIVFMVMTSMGYVAFALVHQFQSKRRAAKAAKQAGAAPDATAAAAAPAPGSDDIDFLLKEAEHRLTSSALGRDARLSRLPVVFLVGQPGGAKTSTLTHCGVEAELLSGQVWQEGLIVPTRATNVWFARQTVFLEAGGKLVSDPPRWANLVKWVRSKRFRLASLFLRKPQAPRAALLCVDVESFLKPGARETMQVVARNLNARLGEMANVLSVNLPVYVLFTRTDRVSFFSEYVRNLTDDEVTQVVGATLPVVLGNRVGVYAEEETRRLTDALTLLQFSLCDKRPLFLARENDASKLPGIYEFPREFRKLRTGIVQFLVDVCRPSQLRASAFLRGFYFSGVRPIEVRDSPMQMQQQRRVSAEEATGIFSLRALAEPAEPAQPSPGSRRIPQWLFLSHLFNDVILADRAALGASGRNIQTDLLRRILFACGAGLALLLGLAWTISYLGNRALEHQVLDAARGISAIPYTENELPSVDSLQRLETLRESVETLTRYHRDGPPWSLRWGLYTGDSMYASVRRLYFGRFHSLMFGATQAGILSWLQRLPDAPGPTDEYTPAYNTLRAYLITTSHHEKSTVEFLSPFLYSHWLAGRPLDTDRAHLAQQQFDFYSQELFYENPYSSENDGAAVARARHYLAQFAAVERIYQAMLAEASRRNKTVNFNRDYPGSGQAVINNKDVLGAFSKDGWAFMDDAIRHASRYLGGEEWVLGPQMFTAIEPDKLIPLLTARYHSDYVANWRAYLANSSIVRYANLTDAARKLNMLSGNQSYLLQLFCVGSVNTNVTSDDAKAPFQPMQFVTPPDTCMSQLISGNNTPYINALLNLQASLDAASRASGPNDPAINQTLSVAQDALRITRQVANNFRPDRDANPGVDKMTQKLMEDPITYVLALLGNIGPSQLNGAGHSFCQAFNGIVNKYPFNSASQVDATLPEVDGILRPPDGLLWTFYEANLKQYLQKVGSQYVPAPGSNVHLTPQFVRFFNHAAQLSDAFYAGGAHEPHLTYNMKAMPSEGLKSMTLLLDGQTLKSSGSGGPSMQFNWPGNTHLARMNGSLGGGEFGFENYDGLWAVFRMFGDADRSTPSGAGYIFEWVPRQGQNRQPMTLENGRPLTVRYYLEMNPPIFQKGWLSGFECVSRVAQ